MYNFLKCIKTKFDKSMANKFGPEFKLLEILLGGIDSSSKIYNLVKVSTDDLTSITF